VLFHAVSAAGNWEIDDAWDRVAELVDSKKTPKDVRLAAIDAIAEIRPEEAQERLVELAEDRDEDIAAAASEAMAMAESRLECEASVFGDEDEEFDEDDEEDEDEKGH